MISEKRFISLFRSCWQGFLPTGGYFIKYMNKEVNREENKKENKPNKNPWRFCEPLHSRIHPKQYALANEMGVSLFTQALRTGRSIDKIARSKARMNEIFTKASLYVNRFPGYIPPNYNQVNEDLSFEAVEISEKTRDFFRERLPDEPITTSPQFQGCGLIDDCEGDFIVRKTLFEFKGGDRAFGIIDIRQILVYLALNESSGRHEIDKVGLVNPRLGVFYECKVDELIDDISGKSSVELLSDLIHFMSDPGISR